MAGIKNSLATLFACGAVLGAPIRVPADYATIEEALQVAQKGDEIHVAPGEYTIVRPLVIAKSVRLYSESGAEKTTIRMSRNPEDPKSASVIMLLAPEGGGIPIIRGFTLTGGMGTEIGSSRSTGGGVCCAEGGVGYLFDCIVTGNRAYDGGGVFCAEGGLLESRDCRIEGNSASSSGGGVCCEGSVYLKNCTISDNRAEKGGGVSNSEGTLEIYGCKVEGNIAVSGGGVNCDGPSVVLKNSRISGNRASSLGGGVYFFRARLGPVLENCTVVENCADMFGGGICVSSGESPLIRNCTFSGNAAGWEGGGLFCDRHAEPIVVNCILWGNAGGSVGGEGSPSVRFSCVEGEDVRPGEGNTNRDPLFCGRSGSEVWVGGQEELEEALSGFSYALGPGSPCIGSAEDGVDMGAEEGRCETRGSAKLLVHLSEGTYQVSRIQFALSVSLKGAGEDRTILEGMVCGLRSGAFLSDLTVRAGEGTGIRIGRGESPVVENCTIRGEWADRTARGGVVCGPNSAPVLRNCTICDHPGVGVYCAEGSSPRIENCTVLRNVFGVGCGWGSSPTLLGCRISGNAAYMVEGGGGGLYCGEVSSPVLIDCTISQNFAREGGAAACREGATPVFRNCTVASNSTTGGTGGIYLMEGASASFLNCIIWDNTGEQIGGEGTFEVRFSCVQGEKVLPGEGNINADPLFCGWFSEEVSVSGSEAFKEALQAVSYGLAENSPCLGSGEGGADMGSPWTGCKEPGPTERKIDLAEGEYRIPTAVLSGRVSLRGAGKEETVIAGTLYGPRSGTVLSDIKVVGGYNGAVRIPGGESPVVLNSTISGGYALNNFWPGVLCGKDSSPVIEDCIISEHIMPGVTCLSGAFLSLRKSTIRRNSGHGVIFFHGSSGVIEDCVISENQGGVSFSGELPFALRRCKVIGNGGNGVRCTRGSRPIIENCVIAGNAGSGIYSGAASWPVIRNCTIFKNGDVGGFGVCCDSRGLASLANCIVWANKEGSFGGRGASLAAYSCIEGEEVWPGDGNMNEDPWFVDEGVFDFSCVLRIDFAKTVRISTPVIEEPDLRLRTGSPCIDSGMNISYRPSKDIIGNRRRCGRRVDMGAYEMGCAGEETLFKRGDANSDGKVNISDVVYHFRYIFGGGVPPLCLDSADTTDDGVLDLADAITTLSFLFVAGEPPAEPFRACGTDPTPEKLDCLTYPPCAGSR